MDKQSSLGSSPKSVQPLTEGQKKLAVDHLLQHTAVWLLADLRRDKNLMALFEKKKGRLMQELIPEQKEILAGMREMIDRFCQMLVNCRNVDQLWLAFSYLGELEKGRVLIAPDVEQIPEGYTTNGQELAGPLDEALK